MFILRQEGIFTSMKDKIDGWFELLSDEQRGDVMKTHIKETEQTHRDLIATEGYHVVRGFIVVASVIIAITLSVAAYNITDIVVRTNYPAQVTTSASGSASALK